MSHQVKTAIYLNPNHGAYALDECLPAVCLHLCLPALAHGLTPRLDLLLFLRQDERIAASG